MNPSKGIDLSHGEPYWRRKPHGDGKILGPILVVFGIMLIIGFIQIFTM